jgi:hypothetical protein
MIALKMRKSLIFLKLTCRIGREIQDFEEKEESLASRNKKEISYFEEDWSKNRPEKHPRRSSYLLGIRKNEYDLGKLMILMQH